MCGMFHAFIRARHNMDVASLGGISVVKGKVKCGLMKVIVDERVDCWTSCGWLMMTLITIR